MPNGRRVLTEIDGGVHLTLAARWKDTAKDNDAMIAGETTLRFPSVAIYADDPVAVAQLIAALRICQQQASTIATCAADKSGLGGFEDVVADVEVGPDVLDVIAIFQRIDQPQHPTSGLVVQRHRDRG
jgi:hypothetical protein